VSKIVAQDIGTLLAATAVLLTEIDKKEIAMPLMKCEENGKKGWKWGEHGKCYTGPDAREKALSQMRAIKRSQAQGKKR